MGLRHASGEDRVSGVAERACEDAALPQQVAPDRGERLRAHEHEHADKAHCEAGRAQESHRFAPHQEVRQHQRDERVRAHQDPGDATRDSLLSQLIR